MNKLYPSATAALKDILKDGQTLGVGGFGLCGIPEALIAAVQRFEALQGGIDPQACRRNAERFSAAVFRAGLQQQVALALEGCR
jgi:hypothetical protein